MHIRIDLYIKQCYLCICIYDYRDKSKKYLYFKTMMLFFDWVYNQWNFLICYKKGNHIANYNLLCKFSFSHVVVEGSIGHLYTSPIRFSGKPLHGEPTSNLEIGIFFFFIRHKMSAIVSFLNWFYWSIVDLQFALISAVQQSDSVIHIYTRSFSLWFITGYQIESPVLYSRTLLFIHYIHNNLHLLIPNSPSIPLHPNSHLATSLLSMSVSLFLFHK